MTFVGPDSQLVDEREDYDPIRGHSFVQVFEGSEMAMRGIKWTLNTYRPELSVSIESVDDPKWQCVVRSPDPFTTAEAFVLTLWELHSNDINKSIYEHPNSLLISSANIDVIRKGMQNEDSQSVIGNKLTGGPSTSYSNALLLLDFLKRGVTDFIVSQFVLRRQQVVTSKYQIAESFSNIDAVMTTAQIQSSESIPPAIVFSLSVIPMPAVSDPILYRAGWLKKSPTVRQTSNNRFEIQQEWWLGVFPYYLYATAV